MFLGIYDPDRKKPARQKLAEAADRYAEKFGARPTHCLTSPLDAAELLQPTRLHPDPLEVVVQARSYIGRWLFYLGEDAGEVGSD